MIVLICCRYSLPATLPPYHQKELNGFSSGHVDRQLSELDDSFIGLTGGKIFLRMMQRHDVKHIFGIPGGAIMPVFDAIYNTKQLEFVLAKHEQNAGHMAQGYARVSGKPGVVLVTSGPGATNVITAIQDAFADGTPLVVFTGQVPTTALGSQAFQEADIVGISRPCTKWNMMVQSVTDLPKRIDEAFDIAMSGRPGPVLLDLPKNVMEDTLREPVETKPSCPAHLSASANVAQMLVSADLEARIARSAELINLAKNPVIYAGQGILGSLEGPKLLKELSKKAKIPVTTTMQGLGAFDEMSPRALHMLGMHGSVYANKAMQEADLIIALGARFDDRVTGCVEKFAPNAKAAAREGRGGIIHFDIQSANINKVVQATEAVEGDVTQNLAAILPLIETVNDRSDWLNKIDSWKERFPLHRFERKLPDSDDFVQPQQLIEKLSQITDPIKHRTIIATGVGQHQMWVAQHFRWRYPRSWVGSGGMGTMGFGLPSAMGAKFARPDALVINVDGDGSFNMSMTELSTASQYNIGVKIIVLNNKEHGMVTQWQSLFYDKRYSHAHQKNPDFQQLSETMGVPARKCLKMADIEESLRWLLEDSGEGPALLEVMIPGKLLVLPMVPGGKGLDEMLIYDGKYSRSNEAT
jgi:acetolactate synthase I/II/III large subunit